MPGKAVVVAVAASVKLCVSTGGEWESLLALGVPMRIDFGAHFPRRGRGC